VARHSGTCTADCKDTGKAHSVDNSHCVHDDEQVCCCVFSNMTNNKSNNNSIRSLRPCTSFSPVAIETAGSWGHQAIELVQEIGRHIADITADGRETTFLFQRLSMALQRGNAVSFLGTFPSD